MLAQKLDSGVISMTNCVWILLAYTFVDIEPFWNDGYAIEF